MCWAFVAAHSLPLAAANRGYSLVAVQRLLVAAASRCRAWALVTWASVVLAFRPSCPTACGIFLDQGLNLCPLHWQMNSSPLDHEASPTPDLLFILLCSALCSRRFSSRIISTSSTGFVFFPSFYFLFSYVFRKSTGLVPSRVILRSPFQPTPLTVLEATHIHYLEDTDPVKSLPQTPPCLRF